MRDGGLRRLLPVVEGVEKRPLEVVLEVVEAGGEVPSSDEHVGALVGVRGFWFFLGRFSPDSLDLDFGVTGAVRAERKERAVADMLRAEKKKS